jgi:hypothetical protein
MKICIEGTPPLHPKTVYYPPPFSKRIGIKPKKNTAPIFFCGKRLLSLKPNPRKKCAEKFFCVKTLFVLRNLYYETP